MFRRNIPDNPFLCVLATAVFYGASILAFLALSHFDPSVFVCAGDRFCDPARVPPALSVERRSNGYDGQFYYRLALDPFTRQVEDFGITLDAPSYRCQRMLYPFTAWLLSGGRAEATLWWMIGVNLAALATMAWFGANFAQSANKHALWGLLFPLYPGFLISLQRDLTEIFSCTFLLAALWQLRRRNHLQAALLLTLAALARETVLVLPAVFAGALLLRGGTRSGGAGPWLAVLTPFSVYAVWQAVLAAIWRTTPFSENLEQLGPPLLGFLPLVRDAWVHNKPHLWLWLGEVMALAAWGVFLSTRWRASTAPRHEKLAWLLYAMLALCLTKAQGTYARLLCEFHVLGVCLLFGPRKKLEPLDPGRAGSGS